MRATLHLTTPCPRYSIEAIRRFRWPASFIRPPFPQRRSRFCLCRSASLAEWPGLPALRKLRRKRIGRLTGKTSRPGLRKCYACRKTFTVRIGTIFEDSHFPLHLWLQAIQLDRGEQERHLTRQIQRTFNCSMKTAWFLTHRIRETMKPANDGIGSPMGGEGKTIEADLTFRWPQARHQGARRRRPHERGTVASRT